MTVLESIILGVISGVLTSFLLLLITQLIWKVLIPRYQQIVYDGIDISGEWHSEIDNPSGNTQTMIMNIEQSAGRFNGVISISKRVHDSDSVELKTYSVNGTIRDRFVNIISRNTNKRNLGMHLELLEVIGDGELIRGKRMWYSATDMIIQAENMEWTRKKVTGQQ